MEWTTVVDDEGVLTFPPDMIEKLGWKEGDTLEWINNADGTYTLKKLEETNGTV